MNAVPLSLGVNIDHVATVRQARRTYEPSPVTAAALAELAGADQITLHLREDRRHMQDEDVRILRKTITTRMNLEMALAEEIMEIALEVRPDHVTLVPEERKEVTTEGGLAVAGREKDLSGAVERLQDAGILVSLFIDPVEKELGACRSVGAGAIEIHTGRYANARGEKQRADALTDIERIAGKAVSVELRVHAGHGLTYTNVAPVARIGEIVELNIGHSIIARSVFVGIGAAVRDMKDIILKARGRTSS
ncbi:MAG: pyridoxine 5'-phosphate synthase [Planctomycetota bacterium]